MAAATAQHAEQDKRLVLEQRLSTSEQFHYKELRDAQKNQDLLRDRLATFDLRLSVLIDAGSAVAVRCLPPPAPAAWFIARYEPNLAPRMLNELSPSPMKVIVIDCAASVSGLHQGLGASAFRVTIVESSKNSFRLRRHSIKHPPQALNLALCSSLGNFEMLDLPADICCLHCLFSQSRHVLVPLADGFGVHLDQLEYPLPLFAKLPVQFLEFIFVQPELLTAGFEWSRASEPVICVFDVEGVYGRCLVFYCLYIQQLNQAASVRKRRRNGSGKADEYRPPYRLQLVDDAAKLYEPVDGL